MKIASTAGIPTKKIASANSAFAEANNSIAKWKLKTSVILPAGHQIFSVKCRQRSRIGNMEDDDLQKITLVLNEHQKSLDILYERVESMRRTVESLCRLMLKVTGAEIPSPERNEVN